MNELDIVALTEDLPNLGLRKGDVGTIVLLHKNGEAFEVEFMTLGGETVAIETLYPSQIRAIESNEVANARAVPGEFIDASR